MKKKEKIIAFLIIVQFLLISCSSVWLKYDEKARELQFIRKVVSITDFNIVIYKNNLFGLGKRLHIYLDGDGSPWNRDGLLVNSDPTPRQYLVLQLMSLDSSPAVLIGRPCYHGFSQDIHCHPLLWTHARYSEKVVSAIHDAIQNVFKESSASELVLIGYSGGGTLAMLAAERILQTRAVVTLAGNLDLAGWARLHGYSLLEGSLDPAERLPLPEHILQIHYTGRGDNNIPPWLVESYLSNKSCGEMQILEDVDHYSGWLIHWSKILLDLRSRLSG
jgi:hypothetical protein